jgi:glycosyltransferase involved in cell wall biosynthesis
LLLVGDGPEREDLEDRVQHLGLTDRVTFTGSIPYTDIPGFLAMADAFVTASVTEVHPLSIIEAMAAGLPVLGVLSPGVGDTIEDGLTGFLTDHEIAAFTAKMTRLVTHHENRRIMGQQARSASEQYDIRRTTQTLLSVYNRLVQTSEKSKSNLRSRFIRILDNWRA